MLDSPAIAVGLPIGLAIIMFGLGLTLSVPDFVRVGRSPKATILALVCQSLVLPAICAGLVIAVNLDPLLAVGMMLLAASPGGTTANLFSHLAGGDVALNITLTASAAPIEPRPLPRQPQADVEPRQCSTGCTTIGRSGGGPPAN
ncbi:MAG: bile acid:sodium symporter family protein [Geodermatophilaceae bacterium]